MPDFGVYIKVQGAGGEVEYRTLSRQLVLFCVERRKAWRLLQSKAGIENREYKAQRAILAEVDSGKISKEELFANGEALMKARVGKPVSHAAVSPSAASPGAVSPAAAAVPAVKTPPPPLVPEVAKGDVAMT